MEKIDLEESTLVDKLPEVVTVHFPSMRNVDLEDRALRLVLDKKFLSLALSVHFEVFLDHTVVVEGFLEIVTLDEDAAHDEALTPQEVFDNPA